MFILSAENFKPFLTGSLLFGTGGGLPFGVHEDMMRAALVLCPEIEVLRPDEFAPDEFLITVYGVGDPATATAALGDLVATAFPRFQKLTGMMPSGIVPGECGAEGVAFLAAAALDLPVVDADLVGGRAAPLVSLDVFGAFELPITPVLAVSASGKELLFSGPITPQEIEIQLRSFASGSGGSVLLVGYPIKAGAFASMAISGTMARNLAVGELLAAGDMVKAVRRAGGRVVAQATLTAIDLNSADGFFQGTITLGPYTIKIKNEHLVLIKGKRKVVIAPDLVALIDEDGVPLHNTDASKRIGAKFSIVKIPATGYWEDPRKRALWGQVL